ncbi:SAM-dependent methyltransferase [Phytomonospora sp. NPDC050363]|uniref:SAM-dependent methyltransferase n=1 Tax=Phytomonospora sp. NPDC050363 TaxID=3155642 RepID=UPI0033F9F541
MAVTTWRKAIQEALYGIDGFYRRHRPADHFATSANRSAVFAEAIVRVLRRVDAALGHPEELTVVDIGAGSGELLSAVLALSTDPVDNSVDNPVDKSFADRLRPVCVELRHRPVGLDPRIEWRDLPPSRVTGAVLACEWLDNVPLDVATVDEGGRVCAELVDPVSGATTTGEAVDDEWLSTWWPLSEPGQRAEIGRPRDLAWAGIVSTVKRGVALAVDYGHTRTHRPPFGTLAGFAAGRELPPVPDGSRDITAHVAMDAVAAAGVAAGARTTSLARQREALRELGFSAERPPLAMASQDPAGYLRALARVGEVAELTDPYGLGAHWWLLQRVSC